MKESDVLAQVVPVERGNRAERDLGAAVAAEVAGRPPPPKPDPQVAEKLRRGERP